jgi:hypothetical protein
VVFDREHRRLDRGGERRHRGREPASLGGRGADVPVALKTMN